MLKDLIEKHTEVLPVSDRINVVDMLTNESAQDQLKLLFVGMTETCQELEKFEQVGEQLKNESGLVTYLASQGYEDLTTESAGEVAKEVWEKIKKDIAYLIDQFMIYFNKAKLLFMNLINNHEGKIKALLAILERTKKNAPNKDLMDSESFGKRIPHFENFHDVTIYLDYFNLIKESSVSVYSLDSKINSTIEKTLGNGSLKSIAEKRPRAFLGFESNNMLNLMIKDFKYSIDNINISTTYNPTNKITMKPDKIKIILESLLNLLKDIKFSVNQISTKIVKYKNPEMEEEGIFSKDNIEHNVSVIIRASKMFVENNNKIIKDIIFILTQHIKCYDDPKQLNKLISDDDSYAGDKRLIKEAIRDKDWKTLEEFKDSPSLKKFPDLIKMIEDALKNK